MMKINKKSGVVNIWEIPNVVVHLESSFCLEMFKKLKQIGSLGENSDYF